MGAPASDYFRLDGLGGDVRLGAGIYWIQRVLTTVSLGQPTLAASCASVSGEACDWCADGLLEVLEVFEAEDLAAAHEVDDLAGGAVDGVHADEVGLFVEANGVEAVVDVGLHGVEGVGRVAEGPSFVVGEDGGDVVELIGGEVWARSRGLCGEGEECEGRCQEHGFAQ